MKFGPQNFCDKNPCVKGICENIKCSCLEGYKGYLCEISTFQVN